MDIKIEMITDWYKKYGDSLFKYICMMTMDYQQAQDLTQETFIKAYEKYETFQQGNVKGWLFKIAHNVTIDFLRSRRPLLLFEQLLSFKKDAKLLPEDVLLINEENKEMYRLIGSMKENYKQVIILRKIKEFSTEETSVILNWTEGQVRTTLHRAMQQLKKLLDSRSDLSEKVQ